MLSSDITREKIPCLYELLFKAGDPPVLKIRLHKDFVEKNKDIIPLALFLERFQRDHGLGEFLPFSSGYFGFDNAVKQGQAIGDFIEYDIEIPVLRKELPEPCEDCKGTGWDKNFDRECSWCNGSKHNIFYDWKPLFAVSASLHVLDMMTETFDQKISSENCQLLTFQVACGKGMGGFPMSGSYGIDFCNWLASLPKPYQFTQAANAMQDVHKHIFKRDSGLDWDFRAYVEDNTWLIINCPGDACGIHPSDSYWKPGRGREYSCHNMDSPVQQIMILVALAVLSDMAKKYMGETST